MLDIGVGDAIQRPTDSNEPSLGFDNDGYYWFLYPLFERLAAETGQCIDLYGDAAFAGPDLDALGRALSEARRSVASQPDSWLVQTAIDPVLRERVSQDVFLRLLAALDSVVSRARASGRAVICSGD